MFEAAHGVTLKVICLPRSFIDSISKLAECPLQGETSLL
jgi:hypothetical protein